MQEPWYVSLFKNYARQYEKEPFAQGTIGECDFLEKEFGYNKNLSILDVGCGTGRHTIELTKRGYQVTGIDLSEAQLALAKERAQEQGLNIRFLQADARNLSFHNEFDAAIMLCEGGFCLMETDDENTAILASVARALKDDALFVFTCLNGLFPLKHSLKAFYQGIEDSGQAEYENSQFDFLAMRDNNTTTFIDDDQNEHTFNSNERYYLPSEISTLLTGFGFEKIHFFGATLGSFSRDDTLTDADFEMLVVAHRQLTNNHLIKQYTTCIRQNSLERGYRLILEALSLLKHQVTAYHPDFGVGQLYQGYLDMSYIGIVTPLLQSHGLKVAVVYLHKEGRFEAWLAAKNRTIQEQYRTILREKVKEPYHVREKQAGEDAIIVTLLEKSPDFCDLQLLAKQLKEKLVQVIEDMQNVLESIGD